MTTDHMSDDLRNRVARAMAKHHTLPWEDMPEARRERLLAYADAAIADIFVGPVTDAKRAAEEYNRSALAEMGGVQVKPLVWEVKSERTQWARVRHVAGRYIIEDRLHGPHYDLWSGFNATSAQRFDTLEAAKAAANKDHRARILAAIEPAPSVRGLPDVSLMTMTLSNGRKDHYVRITCEGCVYDVRRYPDHQINRAEYEVAELRHVLLGEPEPDLMDERYADTAIEPAPSARDEGSEMKLAYDAYRKGQRDALDDIRVADPRVILSRVRAIAEGRDDA